jgi:uroporphyrinogen-III synthase
MTRPLVVGNTRPLDQAAELSELLREAGFVPLDVPAIQVLPLHAPDLARIRQRVAAGEYAWLILPSRNAATFLAADVAVESLFQSVRVLCGSATAASLGVHAAETLDHFSAAAALAWLRPRLQAGQRVLVPRAADGRDELLIGLRDAGVDVDAPVVYRTVAVAPAALRTLEQADAITVCSPSAVHALAAAIDLRATPIVCLGQTTADAVARHGVRASAVADATSMRALVDSVRKTLAAPGVAV